MAVMYKVLINCTFCGTTNRVPTDRLKDRPKCGRCGEGLSVESFITDKPVIVTDDTFVAEVLESPLPVVVDCWASWCGPCRAITPIMEKFAKEYAGRFKIVKLNTDENTISTNRYKIMSVPALLFFQNGVLVDTMTGTPPESQIRKKIEEFL